MMLYKYYGYEAGLEALKSQRLGFRSPKYFNDPLELSFPIGYSSAKSKQLVQALNVLRNWVAILSLTNNPLDPLMWAHYGESHRGFVIGYNTSGPFLSSPEYNLITVDEGAVIYSKPSSSKIAESYNPATIQNFLHYGLGASLSVEELDELRHLARQAFLTKHPRWSTEDEVRVVKLLNSAFDEVSVYQADPLRKVVPYSRTVAPEISCQRVPGLSLYEHKVKIEEVYLGARNPMTGKQHNLEAQSDATLAKLAKKFGWMIRGVCTRPDSWDLHASDLKSDDLVITQQEKGLTHYSEFSAETARALAKLAACEIGDRDLFEVSTWEGRPFLRKNWKFI